MQRRQSQIQPTDLRARASGGVVRELREQACHSQEHLSADCGFDRTYISRVERGIINPTVSRLWDCRCIGHSAQLFKDPREVLAGRREPVFLCETFCEI
jgi:transcriptional regulator with XRE-family HTH domain